MVASDGVPLKVLMLASPIAKRPLSVAEAVSGSVCVARKDSVEAMASESM